MSEIVISGTGLYTPPNAISNDELVKAFNQYVDNFNEDNQGAIEAGQIQPLAHSSSEFILKASGIKSRYVVGKDGILDPEVMMPLIPERDNDKPSVMIEMAMHAADQALKAAGRSPEDVDLIICAASNMQRPYPAMAVELQHFIGAKGLAFDMNVACSSATFGIANAAAMLKAGSAKLALVVNPEICSGHLNFRDRDSHFIFGDACTATVLERAEDASSAEQWLVKGEKLITQFSNNIRNNFGFLNRTAPEHQFDRDKLFVQEGRKVFKEVVPMVSELISSELARQGLTPNRLWLHQANINMNLFIARKVLGRDASDAEAPVILDEYANTSSAGSVIAFHKHRSDLNSGDVGIICSFGAGYSAGCITVQKR
ncbi:beta-ketoacyl-ACP synthase III [Gallaecimonas xiamenensis]|uniref:3-oxoacyl-(Acyl carrier protein) synthase III n=1 Tax=Gallaecimonas xiamenensis 3-C-1 TaxID=745411 RepID=K2J0W3_9GAMM|nr:beta-ketoacyl-ACP synthase III [Gallaecimonas xiamenensis]EKE68668.1 3-oxoacyl-(acyl carrier protein) synthase III [Gallaecimonas xiamenensis 3-C-1]